MYFISGYRGGVGKAYARRINFFSMDVVVSEEDESDDTKLNLQQLCDKAWTLFRVSPLFGFKSDVFDAWRNVLSRELGHEKEDIVVEEFRGLRGSDGDPQAVKVECGKNALSAVLLGVQCARETRRSLEPDTAVVLPVLLLRGVESAKFVKVLEKCFDCVVAKVAFEEDELRWAAAMWLDLKGDDDDNEEEDDLSIKYGFEPTCSDKQLTNIDLELKLAQMRNLWLSIHDPAETLATRQEVAVFHDALAEQIRASTKGLDVASSSRLSSVLIPKVVKLESPSSIRFLRSCHVKTVLRFLTDVCDISLECATPSLGVPATGLETM